MNYADNEILLYDLSNRPASFDFVTCMATAIGIGCKHVRFVLGGWKKKNYADPAARFLSIVEPAAALYGIDYSIGERKGLEVNHLLRASIECFKQHGRIGKIRYEEPERDYVTITLRASPGRSPERDSKDDEWLEFAHRCDRKCLILRDNEDSSLHLHDRMKLYAGAYLNMMVINGPLTLCIHSDAPYVSMRTIGGVKSGSTSPTFSANNGITPGFQFPWAHARQRLSYLDDTVDNILNEYHTMSKRKKAA